MSIKSHHLARIRALAEVGLSDRSIAAVLNLDFPELETKPRTVEHYRKYHLDLRRPCRNPDPPPVRGKS